MGGILMAKKGGRKATKKASKNVTQKFSSKQQAEFIGLLRQRADERNV
jgi:hypothetical protein